MFVCLCAVETAYSINTDPVPGAPTGCQKSGPSDPIGVIARFQLQLRQINNPLLKMRRFMRPAGGHTVPECDTLQL